MPRIVDIDIELPKRSEAAAAQYRVKKPLAKVRFIDDASGENVYPVPPRVARAALKELPDLPCELHSLSEWLLGIDERLCYAAMLEMLARRDHAVREVEQKLARTGYRRASIEAAVARAQQQRFLNDERFSDYFIRERVQRGWGRRKIELELKRRGVDVSMLPGYPETYFSREDDLERASALLARKRIPDRDPYPKLMRFLVGKGFDYAVASQAARDRLDTDS